MEPQLLPNLSRLRWLVHGFSTRQGGTSGAYGGKALNLGFTREDDHSRVLNNRRRFLRCLGATSQGKPWPLVLVRQIHSDVIHEVTKPLKVPPAGDGLVTDVPGLLLGVLTADCLAVAIADPEHRAVGVFHAGWRGTLARIVAKGLGKMAMCYGTRPQKVRVGIGPGIHACCYQVGEEVRARFRAQFHYADQLFREVQDVDPVRERYPLLFMNARAPGHAEPQPRRYLDLVEGNRRQLLECGVPGGSIVASDGCTACRPDWFFSHRAEKGKTGRMLGVIGLRP